MIDILTFAQGEAIVFHFRKKKSHQSNEKQQPKNIHQKETPRKKREQKSNKKWFWGPSTFNTRGHELYSVQCLHHDDPCYHLVQLYDGYPVVSCTELHHEQRCQTH